MGQSWPASDGNERVLCIPQTSSFTGASPSDCLVSYPGHLLARRDLTPLLRSSGYILQPNRLGHGTLVGEEVLPRCWEAVGIFYSPTDWATGHLLRRGSYPAAEKQWVYSTAQPTGPRDTCWGGGLTPLLRSSGYILQPNRLGHGTLVGEGVLPRCWEAVGIFYSPTDWATGHLLGRRSYPSAEKLSVCSTAHWADLTNSTKRSVPSKILNCIQWWD